MATKEFLSLSKAELRSLTKGKLHQHMGMLSVREREHQADVIAGVCEVERRKLYFDWSDPIILDHFF